MQSVSYWKVQSLKTFNKHIYQLHFDYADQSLIIIKCEAKRTEQKHRVVNVALVNVERTGEMDLKVMVPSSNFQKFFRFQSERQCDDFRELLEAVQISKGRAFRIFTEHDTDGNGILDPQEARNILILTMKRMGLSIDEEEIAGPDALITFEQFLRYYIAGIKSTVKASAPNTSSNKLSDIHDDSGHNLTSHHSDQSSNQRVNASGNAHSAASVERVTSLDSAPPAKSQLRIAISLKKWLREMKKTEIEVKANEEVKPLFELVDNAPGSSPPVVVGNVEYRSSLYGRVQRGMGILAINKIPLESAQHAKKLLNQFSPTGYVLTAVPSQEQKRTSLFSMVNALMLDNQLDTNKLEVPRLSGELTMQPPCSAMRLTGDVDATNTPLMSHGAPKRSKVRAGIVEVTNYRIIFMENSTGLVSDMPLGTINKIEVKTNTVTIPASLGVGNQIEVAITSKQTDQLRLIVNESKGVHTKIEALAFPEDQRKVFAFSYKKHKRERRNSAEDVENNGWNFFDAIREYKRLGLSNRAGPFRLTTANWNESSQYELSPTYPSYFCVPAALSDDDLMRLVKHRSKGRIPATVYMHPTTSATLSRCAQPMGGVINKRNKEDERLVAAIRDANPTNSDVIFLMDARPFKAAVGNKVMGKGFEDVSRYKGAEIEFLGIDNIHKIRQAYLRATEACASSEANFYSKVADSRWVYYVQLIVGSATKIAKIMSRNGASVIVHCSDGWDRTAQLTSLVEILLDPYYRTRKGFAVIVEKEWLSFGHKFATRHGHASSKHQDEQRSPIFLQFIDCVWQLIDQFPLEFEFNETFLLAVAKHSYSCLYGTFLFSSEKERKEASLKLKTESVWTRLCDPDTSDLYQNPYYPTERMTEKRSRKTFGEYFLEPDQRRCRFWHGLFLPKTQVAMTTGTEYNEKREHKTSGLRLSKARKTSNSVDDAYRNLKWRYDRLLEAMAKSTGESKSKTEEKVLSQLSSPRPGHKHTPSSILSCSIPISVPLALSSSRNQTSRSTEEVTPGRPESGVSSTNHTFHISSIEKSSNAASKINGSVKRNGKSPAVKKKWKMSHVPMNSVPSLSVLSSSHNNNRTKNESNLRSSQSESAQYAVTVHPPRPPSRRARAATCGARYNRAPPPRSPVSPTPPPPAHDPSFPLPSPESPASPFPPPPPPIPESKRRPRPPVPSTTIQKDSTPVVERPRALDSIPGERTRPKSNVAAKTAVFEKLKSPPKKSGKRYPKLPTRSPPKPKQIENKIKFDSDLEVGIHNTYASPFLCLLVGVCYGFGHLSFVSNCLLESILSFVVARKTAGKQTNQPNSKRQHH